MSSSTNARKRLKIVNPFRFFIFIFICSIITIFAAYAVLGYARADAAAQTQYTSVKIQEDDNLWNLIETYNSGNNVNIRSALYDVYEINDISADSIKPGDIILIPVYK